jgi:hypothetical protein
MKRKIALPAMGSVYDAGHRRENGAASVWNAEGKTLYLAIP